MPEQKKSRRTQLRAPSQSDGTPPPDRVAMSGRSLGLLRRAGEPAAGGEPLFPVACIAASAGGHAAVAALLRRLPGPGTRLSALLIDTAGSRAGSLLELAAQSSTLPVSELRAGERLMPGHIHVLPPATQATLVDGKVELTPTGDGAPPHPADVFLRSLARELRSHAVGVVLSGTGSDGALGLKDVKAEGGVTFAEDPGSAECPALPQRAIAAGGVDFILPVEEIAAELARLGRPGSALASGLTHGPALGVDPELGKLFRLLHAAMGMDFSHYKKSTLKRRIQRRMTLCQIGSLQDYVDHVSAHPAELEALYQDLLIKVTAFFRDPEAFAALKTHVFPVLMHNRPPDSPVRIWVPGCSTGEEVYSLAISLLEFLEADATGHAIQIFGTDVSEEAIQRARSGIYIENIAIDVSPSRLRRFFVRVEGGFQVSKPLRDLCIFSRHNATADPPLSQLDVVSCRNLMIYLEPSLQRRLLHTFHHALKPAGFLLLGSSEGIGTLPELFGSVDRTNRIFCKRTTPEVSASPHVILPAPPSDPSEAPDRPSKAEASTTMERVRKEADDIVMAHHAPAGVVIDEAMQIVQFRGKTGPYLEPAPGDASLHLFKMAREGLLLDLRAAVDESMKSGRVSRREEIKVKHAEGLLRSVNIEVWPLKVRLPQGRCFLVVFAESSALKADPPGSDPSSSESRRELEIVQLRRELVTAREYLQSIIDELEAANEELNCANEELLASNEELESLSERLEAEKEALQSANRELSTVNAALQRSNADLAGAHDDLRTLLDSIDTPVLMLGADLRIRRATGAAERLLGLAAGDVGRSLLEVKLRSGVDIAPWVAEAIRTLRAAERRVQDREGRSYLLRVRPSQTDGGAIDGAVLCWLESDDKATAHELANARDRMSTTFEVLRHPVLLLDGDLRVRAATRRACELFKVAPVDLEGRSLSAVDAGFCVPLLEQRLRDVMHRGTPLVDFRLEAGLGRAGRKTLSLSAFRLQADEGDVSPVLIILDDMTGRERNAGTLHLD